jgi:hypothetical protein
MMVGVDVKNEMVFHSYFSHLFGWVRKVAEPFHISVTVNVACLPADIMLG